MNYLLSFLLSVLFYSCSAPANQQNQVSKSDTSEEQTNSNQTPATIREDVSAERFKQLIDQGDGILLDVRTPEEYAEGNIAGSTNLDFHASTFEASLDTLDKSKPVYVYCKSGGRSGNAADRMKEKGFSAVYNLIGGFSNWPY